MSLSGPGDSTSRSRSLTSIPALFAALGGSGQDRAIRSWPFLMTRVVPAPFGISTAFAASTLNCFSVEVVVLLIGGSPVPSMS